MWRVAEELDSIGHSGASDGVASDASDVHFRARGAYWTSSDAAYGASDESTGASGVNLTRRVLTVASEI
jgi:hypothetical protein